MGFEIECDPDFFKKQRMGNRSMPRLTKQLWLTALAAGLLILAAASFSGAASSRGISVKAKTTGGEVRDIPLYSGYYALVAGCGEYRGGWPGLPNPVNDARQVGDALSRLGWEVKRLEDPDWKTLRRELNRLIVGPGKDPDRAILFWYAGHGHTLTESGGRKLGYIVPVDAPDPDEDELGFMEKGISMRQIETVAKRIRSRHVVMLFDSCFSGAIFQTVRSQLSLYIDEKVKKPVRQFITAGTDSEQVPDASVFKTVFLQGITEGYADRNKDGYVTGMEIGDYIQKQVVNYSRKAQHPQFGMINDPMMDKGDFVFVLKSQPTAQPGPILPPVSPASPDIGDSGAVTRRLRSSPTAMLEDDVKAMLKQHGFFDANWSKISDFENDYMDNGDGTVTDRATGLVWQRSGSGRYNSYTGARQYVKDLNHQRFAGHSDWRLPTLEELCSLVESREMNENLYIQPFFDTKQLWCWSRDLGSSGFVWGVSFGAGRVYPFSLNGLYYVRAVRSLK